MAVLSDRRHEKFAQGLAELLSYADAYEAAGYARSPHNGRKMAQRPEVKARVRELLARQVEFGDITRQRTLVELARIGHANLAEFYERDARAGALGLRDITALPAHLTAALSGLEFDKYGRPKLKLHDKVSALEKIAKALGMWKDGAEVNVGLTVAYLVAASYEDSAAKTVAPPPAQVEDASAEEAA